MPPAEWEDALELVPVGVAHTPYRMAEELPHQGFAGDAKATVEVLLENPP